MKLYKNFREKKKNAQMRDMVKRECPESDTDDTVTIVVRDKKENGVLSVISGGLFLIFCILFIGIVALVVILAAQGNSAEEIIRSLLSLPQTLSGN